MRHVLLTNDLVIKSISINTFIMNKKRSGLQSRLYTLWNENNIFCALTSDRKLNCKMVLKNVRRTNSINIIMFYNLRKVHNSGKVSCGHAVTSWTLFYSYSCSTGYRSNALPSKIVKFYVYATWTLLYSRSLVLQWSVCTSHPHTLYLLLNSIISSLACHSHFISARNPFDFLTSQIPLRRRQ